jgi:hypothetical protein
MRNVFLFTPLLLSLCGCVASIPPVEATRFHLGQAIAPGTVAIEPLGGGDPQNMEYRTYAAAAATALAGAGFTAAEEANSPYIAAVGVSRDSRQGAQKRSPISIGIGGGTGGFGGGASFGIGGSKSGGTVLIQMSIRLMKRADRSTIWEGRAKTQAPATSPAVQPGLAAPKLANALFKDFPGVTGQTITVP